VILEKQFYICYVNDFPNAIASTDINMYADGTELHFSHSDFSVTEKTLQADVENFSS